MATSTLQLNKNELKNISNLFDESLELYADVISASSATEKKGSVSTATSNLETITTRISHSQMFLGFKSLADVPADELKYFLIPALLGFLSLHTWHNDREDVINLARVYLSDYLGRAQSFGLLDKELPDDISLYSCSSDSSSSFIDSQPESKATTSNLEDAIDDADRNENLEQSMSEVEIVSTIMSNTGYSNCPQGETDLGSSCVSNVSGVSNTSAEITKASKNSSSSRQYTKPPMELNVLSNSEIQLVDQSKSNMVDSKSSVKSKRYDNGSVIESSEVNERNDNMVAVDSDVNFSENIICNTSSRGTFSFGSTFISVQSSTSTTSSGSKTSLKSPIRLSEVVETPVIHSRSTLMTLEEQNLLRDAKLQRYVSIMEQEDQIDKMKADFMFFKNNKEKFFLEGIKGKTLQDMLALKQQLKRTYYITLIRYFANQAIEELENIETEKTILAYMSQLNLGPSLLEKHLKRKLSMIPRGKIKEPVLISFDLNVNKFSAPSLAGSAVPRGRLHDIIFQDPLVPYPLTPSRSVESAKLPHDKHSMLSAPSTEEMMSTTNFEGIEPQRVVDVPLNNSTKVEKPKKSQRRASMSKS